MSSNPPAESTSLDAGALLERRGTHPAPSISDRQDLPDELVLMVIGGASGVRPGTQLTLRRGNYLLGSAPACQLHLPDPTISRRHLEVAVLPDSVELRDLGSTNGSFYQGARFQVIRVGIGATFVVGQTELRLLASEAPARARPVRFGDMLGSSPAMREVFDALAHLASTDMPVLITGESGTGKELAARALHEHSARRAGNYVVVDLAGVPDQLIESELFGHVRGAFTGAMDERRGSFEQGDGGSIFLDELGEMSLSVQPRLLRVLETGKVKPVGGARYRNTDVRVIAATNRDLPGEIEAGRFRADLYYRLAVACVRLPPLRQRREDIPALVDHYLQQIAGQLNRSKLHVPPATMDALLAHDWPGNIRQLRNVIERAGSLAPPSGVLEPELVGLGEGSRETAPVNLPFKEAKEQLVRAWERDYLQNLLRDAGGQITLAASRAGIARPHLYRLLVKHGLGR